MGMRKIATGHYCVRQSGGGLIALLAVALAATVASAFLCSNPLQCVVMIGIPLLVAGFAAVQWLLRHDLTLDVNARRYAWRASLMPGARTIGGDLDEAALGLQVAPRPCGSRRACSTGYAVNLVLPAPIGDVELGLWIVREDADTAARQLSHDLALPVLDARGRVLHDPHAEKPHA